MSLIASFSKQMQHFIQKNCIFLNLIKLFLDKNKLMLNMTQKVRIIQLYSLVKKDMLLKQQRKITLEKQIPKILCSSSAYGNTYIFSHVIKPGEDEGIVHMDANGKFLFQHSYPHVINHFQMINEKEVIVLDVPNSRVDIINLEKKQVRSINHQYHFQDVIQMRIEAFDESKLFAVIEKGTYNVHNLYITYYNYNDTHEPDTCKPIFEYESTEGQWTYECPIRKGNSHSQIIWFKPKQEGQIQLSYIDLRQNTKNKGYNVLKFKNTGGEPYGINNFSLTLRTVWEVKQGRFMLIGEQSSKGANHQYKPGVINNNYVYDVAEDRMRQAKFYFLDQKNYCWNDQMIDVFNLGKVSVFYTYKHENDAIQLSPVYFINNETEEIVGEELWKAECYYINYFIPAFDSRLMVQSYHINGEVKEVDFTLKKALDPKQISLYFMLHINQDFDDDLLGDAIELLHH